MQAGVLYLLGRDQCEGRNEDERVLTRFSQVLLEAVDREESFLPELQGEDSRPSCHAFTPTRAFDT